MEIKKETKWEANTLVVCLLLNYWKYLVQQPITNHRNMNYAALLCVDQPKLLNLGVAWQGNISSSILWPKCLNCFGIVLHRPVPVLQALLGAKLGHEHQEQSMAPLYQSSCYSATPSVTARERLEAEGKGTKASEGKCGNVKRGVVVTFFFLWLARTR